MNVKTFLYFAYGSNLLQSRIHINNPSAQRKCIGNLKDYHLDFNYFSKRWGGHAATIIPHLNEHVWGVIWEIDLRHMESLDRQEGVGSGVYKNLTVQVETDMGEMLTCRTYQLCQLPEEKSSIEERLPSKIYLTTIIAGAVESCLPSHYIEKLEKIPHNNFTGRVEYSIN